MKRTLSKAAVILLVTLLMAPILTNLPVFPVFAQSTAEFSITQGENTWTVEAIQGTTDAVTFYDYYYADPYTVTTTADLTIVPNPVGVGQQLQIMAWINPIPPFSGLEQPYEGLTIDITRPDGGHETIGPFDSDGYGYFAFTPTQLGTYSFQLNFPGADYQDGTLIYLPSQSPQYSIIVQEEPVSIPSPPPPPDLWLASGPEGSGHTPYMEYRKSKIYLYEDTTTGALSLILHHNKAELPSVMFGMNMSVNDLPSGAYIALSDDEFDGWWVDPNWVLAGWPDVYRSDSEGAVISGLPADEEWTISVYAGAVGAIDSWEYQTAEGTIPLELLMYPEPGPIVPLYISAELPEEGGVQVINEVLDVPPDSPWNYLIVDSEGEVVADFTLPAGGGSTNFTGPPFTAGGVFRILATSKRGYTTDISVQTDEGSSSEIDGLQAIIDLAPNGLAVVTFTNAPQSGAFAFAGLGASTPVDWFYSIPPRQPIPFQSACPISIDGDNFVDLVLGKPMVILVNLTGLPEENGQVSVRFDGGTIYTKDVTAENITNKCVISFPTIVPNTAGKNKQITGTYILGANVGSLTTTIVSVKATKDLKLFFVWLDNTAYGHVDEATFYNNVRNITAFINATYPVKNVTVYATFNGKSVTGVSGPFSSLAKGKAAIETDCTSVKSAYSKYSLTASATTIGIGIAPNNTAVTGKPDYFAHKGTATSNYSGAVGYSRGPGTKGVIMLDGYYGGGAHEVAHTFKLYYGIPEQYQGQPWSATGGMPSNGVWAELSQWRTGISFMGLIEQGTFNTTWEDNVYTYLNLFRNLTVTAGDPEIVQTDGLIHKDGTVEFTTNWYHTMGIPDAVDPGDYSLKFLDEENNVLKETSFDAQFFDNIDPGTSIGQDIIIDPKFGTQESETASFAFATEYPAGTAAVQIINNTDPLNPVVMETVDAEDIINYPATEGYFTDSDFNPIDSFDCLFTPSLGGYYRMIATNPATFYYNLQVRNTDLAGLFTITVQIPSDFDLKPLSPRDSPVQIDGKPVAYSFSNGMLTVPNIEIKENELVTLSVHLDYKLKQSCQLFPPSAQTTYSKAYDFTATLNSAEAPTATITAVGKKVTAIGGLIRDLLGEPKGGLTVTVTTKTGSVVGTDITSSDGFYFIAVPPGTYTVKVSNSFGTLIAQAKNVKATQNLFEEKNFWLLLSIWDAAIKGFVKDDVGNSVPGVTVELLKGNTLMATTTTNLGGYYMFRFFLPGQYTIRITVPEGYTATTTSETIWINLGETATVNFKLTHILP